MIPISRVFHGGGGPRVAERYGSKVFLDDATDAGLAKSRQDLGSKYDISLAGGGGKSSDGA